MKVRKRPKGKSVVGYWVVAVSPQQDFIKWGKDGNTVYPYDDDKEAMAQAEYLASTPNHKDDRFYLLKLHSNGQMVTYEIGEEFKYGFQLHDDRS